jgi:hypothetical protein
MLSKKKKGSKRIDDKLLQVVESIKPSLTQIGGLNDLYFVVEASIASTPNRDAAFSGIDRISLKSGLHGTQKYGSLLSIPGCAITPLIKWRDVLNGGKEGIQVRHFYTSNSITINYKITIKSLIILIIILFLGLVSDIKITNSFKDLFQL